MSVADERACSNQVEFLTRRLISSILYYRVYRKIFSNTPWYTPGAIKFLSKNIDVSFKVFEYGTGQSSIWYSQRVFQYVGIENNEKWYNLVRRRINYDNNDIIFEPQKEGYIQSISKYQDGFFDLISIDVRHRVECLLNALPKLIDNGFIVFDDSQRPKYKTIFEIMNKWKKYIFDFGILQTTLFTKRDN